MLKEFNFTMCYKIKDVAKLIFCLGIFVFIPYLYANELKENVAPVSLFSQIKSSYNAGFYPDVIKKGTEFQNKFPQSVLVPEVLIYKAESLYLLDEKEQAKKILLQAKKSSGSIILGKINYWLARIEADSANYLEAAHLFSSAATLLKNSDSQNIQFYYDSLQKGAICAIESGNPASAISPLEYLTSISDQKFQNQKIESCLNLFRAYSLLDMNREIVDVFTRLSPGNIPQNEYHLLATYTANACVQLKEYTKAYDLYFDLVKNASSDVAVDALKSLWNIEKNISNKNMEKVLLEAEKRLEENPLLIADFRTRLGLDSFREGMLSQAQKSLEISNELLQQQEQNLSSDAIKLKILNQRYLTEIAFINSGCTSEAAQKAFVKLSFEEQNLNSENTDKTFFAQMARYATLAKDYENAILYGQKALPVTEAAYWLSFSLFQTEQKKECIQILEKYIFCKENPDLPENLVVPAKLLYADVLFQLGKQDKAMDLFNSLEEKSLLDFSGMLDYAVSALRLGKNQLAQKIAEKTNHLETNYVLSLVAFNQQDWQTLEEKTKVYLSESGGKNKINAEYFYAFALFRQNKYEQAFEAFINFLEKEQTHKLARDAQKNALVCGMQLHQQTAKKTSSWLDKAVKLAENLVRTAPTMEEKESSVLIAAKIYVDADLLDNGLKVLKPYLKRNDSYGMKCRFYTAEILLNKKDYAGADKLFAEVEKNSFDKVLAEHGSYRRAEVFYLANQFDEAAQRFVSYRKKYPNGIYVDSALYFNGESLKRLNKIDNAILCYEVLVQQFSKSTFKFSALAELVLLYKEKQEYEAALKIANQLMKENRQQALLSDMDSHIRDLEALTLDVNQRISELESKYQKAGEVKTVTGRALALSLSELYLSVNETEKAVSILNQLLDNIDKESEEVEVVSNAYYLLAKWHSDTGDFRKGASLYLDSAGLFILYDLDLAARAMYRGAESFSACGMQMDAKSVVNQMFDLFPDNEWTQAASKWR